MTANLPTIPADVLLWTDLLPGGAHWSGIVRYGTTLRFTDLTGGANCSAIFFNQEEKLERYNMADTLKAQHTAHLTQGHVCYSDMGRILCSITGDTLGWHDPLCGPSNAYDICEKYGERRYQEARNEMYRNGRDGLLIELAKWGLGTRDLVATVNFFSKVWVDGDGGFHYESQHSPAGAMVDLRFEMNCLVALTAAPHPLTDAPEYQPGAVGITAWRSGPAQADDPCRVSCAENGRGFQNTERYFRGVAP
ncbi:MAG: urea amidolyase associated protein UAAP1 [Burkholderiales bacterium]